MLFLSIIFCAHAMYEFNRRGKLLRKRLGVGYDESIAPVALSFVLIISLGAVYANYIYQSVVASGDPMLP